MSDKTSAIEQFLGDIGGDQNLDQPNDNPFADISLENPQPKEDTPEPQPEKEEKLPFHKDPKIQRYIQKELAKAMEGMAPQERREAVQKFEDEDDLVSAFRTIIGDDTPEKVSALKALDRTVNSLREEARSAKQILEDERRAEYEAEQELYAGFEAIEEEYDVDITSNSPQARKTKAEFIEFIEAIASKDSYGEITEYPDFEKSFAIFQSLKAKAPQSATRAKELASRSMARASDASTIPENQSYSWKDVDKYFSKLEG